MPAVPVGQAAAVVAAVAAEGAAKAVAVAGLKASEPKSTRLLRLIACDHSLPAIFQLLIYTFLTL